MDPVCRKDLDERMALKQVYAGKSLYFCSQDCLRMFRDNPGLFKI